LAPGWNENFFVFTSVARVGILTVFLQKTGQMQKTKKSIAKRFKVTGSGKVMRRTPGRRHLLTNKSARQLRTSRPDKSVAPGQVRHVRRGNPHAF
jgi:large subunit ribosomal protein L35